MYMLAEPKRKNRLGLNPRGTLWANDKNKFGQKLLEKMGWTKGKGLGKDEQGVQDPLKVRANSEQKGVGFKDNAEDWVKHFDAFEDVLTNLADLNKSAADEAESEEQESDSKEVQSLELQSKRSTKRVHYQKFTRGKDLSRYNEDDLACVLGSKRSTKKEKKREEEEVEEEEKKEAHFEVGETDKSHGLTTVYGGSLKDYFNLKMTELQRKREGGLLGGKTKEFHGSIPDLEFEPAKTDFSFNISLPEIIEKDAEVEDVSERKKKKKSKKEKKRKLEEEKVEESNERDDHEESVTNLKKKSKKRKTEDKEEEKEEEEQINTTKERKRRKAELKEHDDNVEIEQNERKKKKKTENEDHISESKENIENECKEMNPSEMNQSYVEATSSEHKKKKKKKKREEEQHDNEQNEATQKPLNKLRKLASEISLVDLFKGSAAKTKCIEGGDSTPANGDSPQHEQVGHKPKKKLTAKRSFKEIKSDIEDKLKLKRKKKRKCLENIKENDEEEEEENKKEQKEEEEKSEDEDEEDSNLVTLMVTPYDHENKLDKDVKIPVKCDLETIFPGSNLASIKGYDE